MLLQIYQSLDEASYNVEYYNYEFHFFFVNNEEIGFGTMPILCLNIISKIL